MHRLVRCVAAASLIMIAAGCCAGPYRFYQNAYGFNNPRPDRYKWGPPPPVTTPPGPKTPAVLPPPPGV